MPTEIKEDFIKFEQLPRQGFFSCCTIHLHGILSHFNLYHRVPKHIDSTYQFFWYKIRDQLNEDIKPLYFLDSSDVIIEYQKDVKMANHNFEDQFCDYSTLNYQDLTPFIQKYFSPSLQIQNIIREIETKYALDYENTCVLFFRGNDKKKEITLPDYELYMMQAKHLYQENSNIRFLVQSDETEFLQLFAQEFPNNHVIFWNEIRHMPRSNSTVDIVYSSLNSVMSKNYLAITYIMSKCRYVVCNSGNCSMWIMLFRGHTNGLTQFCYVE